MLMVKEDFISKEEYVSRIETARCSTRELIPRSRRCSRSRRRSRRQRCILFWKRRRNAKAGFNPKTHKQGGRTYERTEVTLEHQREQINTLVFSTTHAQKKRPRYHGMRRRGRGKYHLSFLFTIAATTDCTITATEEATAPAVFPFIPRYTVAAIPTTPKIKDKN